MTESQAPKDKALEIVKDTHAKALKVVAEIYPELRQRSLELAREIRQKTEEQGMPEPEAREAALDELVAEMRKELDLPPE